MKNNDCLTTLGEVLMSADKLPMDADLFMPFHADWSLDTACAVFQVDRYSESDDIPTFAKEHGLGHVLQVAQVEDIVINAQLQRENATPAMLLRAFLFYYDRDAFIDFDAESHHD
jgi:hypothetical protein